MRGRRVVAAATLLLGLLAVGATAGTYSENPDGIFGGRADVAVGGGGDAVGLPGWVIENLYVALLGGGALLMIVAVALTVAIKGRDGVRIVARVGGATLLGSALAVGLFFGAKALALFGAGGQRGVPSRGNPTPSGAADSGAVEGAGAAGGATPPWLPIALFAAVFGVAIYFLLRGSSAGDDADAISDSGRTGAVAVDSGEDGGPAVSIDDVPESNAVYRAWRQMATAAVEATDRTVTASEVARAAVREGFDREAVDRLTALFEEVRYGDRPPTIERERAAEAALESLDGDREVGS